MPSDGTSDRIALALTAVFVVGVLLYGALVVQQLLLAALVALFGVLAYTAWRYLR
ncbi:hypothetical protein [Natronomonas marina]|jgi:hypothetical protein|uniref:hypothetical protein n=1 Tax=Natronomonas marina TaxID=2961939 RepID=UPI0020C9529D|nr:hypothetical protein [Natronomonas marina]